MTIHYHTMGPDPLCGRRDWATMSSDLAEVTCKRCLKLAEQVAAKHQSGTMDCGSVRALCEREMDDETIAEGMLDGARMDGRRSLAAEILDVLKMECRPVAGDLLRRICAYLEDRGDVRSEQLCEEIHAATGLATGLAATEQESVADDSDLIDEDPLPISNADEGFWQWRGYPDGTYDAKAPGAISWVERLRSPRDVWAVLHGWVDIARATEEKSKGQGDEG